MSFTQEPDLLLQGLDDNQRAAAMSIHGPVRIIACAGAGKTRTITRRIAYACATNQWDSKGVLAVTFSVKAAQEMRDRLDSLGVSSGARVSTFHSAALQQIRRVWDDVCSAPFPNVIANPRNILRIAASKCEGLSDIPPVYIRDIMSEINWAKVSLVAPKDYEKVCSIMHRTVPAGLEAQKFIDIYESYEREKNNNNFIDFNDLLLLDCHIIDAFPQAARKIRDSIKWLTVDEYQDVSPLQHELLRLWLGENRNICVVGDPAQTIYSFAGASSYDLLQFPKEFAPLNADISLDTDYRSTERIVGLANRVLSASDYSKDYVKMRALSKGGKRISKKVFLSDKDEALAVAQTIMCMVRDDKVVPSDCAILTRTNAQQDVVCNMLRNIGLSVKVRNDMSVQRTVLDNAELRDYENSSEGNGESNSESNSESVSEDSGVNSGENNGVNSGESASENSQIPDLPLSVSEIMNSVPHSEESRMQIPVNVSTIHASKGLEFKHVFIIGCSDGLIPFGTCDENSENLEEERRLMYVAITRAEKTLQLSYALRRELDVGATRSPSRFLS